jgi:signal transduction histidine kinase
VGYRRTDLAWALPLVLSAGLSVVEMLTAGGDWLPLLLAALAYPAGRWMASLALALWVFTAAAFAGLALAFWHSPDPLPDWLKLVVAELVTSVLPWCLGRYRRLRAEQHRRERGIVAEQARLRERARIAQDMHDSLGHELALIALHGGALELAGGLTSEQRQAAGELRAGAVRATHRLHEIVQVLGSADAAADLQPADESIDDLVGRAAAAGLRVRLRHDGPAPGWSPMTSQAAHRVIQEALTNAARHAPGAEVTVTVAGTRIDVVNEPSVRPGGGPGTGQGLIGLDERVRLAGGRIDAGPRPGGGWAVTAVLPDSAEPRRDDDGPPGFELGSPGRRPRRGLLQTTGLPLGVGAALIVAVAAVQVLTVTRTGLSADRYDQLRPGQPRAHVALMLPPHDISQVPAVIAPTPRPAGATCVYYSTGDSLLDFDTDLYQLCFVDDVLVSKDRLARA